MIVSLLEELRIGKYDASSLNSILYAASPMPVETLKNAMKGFPKCRFFQSYGSTEVAGTTLSDEDHDRAIMGKEDLLLSCGLPWPETQIKIVGEDGTEARKGEIGEIAMRTERMMVGYWKSKKETSETIRDGWLFTGDMGKLNEHGYLFISDRKKDMVISGGENVYPAEVEDVLTKHPAVLEAAVIGVPDKKWMEAVKALLILRKGMKATEREIIDFCKSHIAGYKCPKSVDFVTELPKSPAGKILKRVLRARAKIT
jgi:acyl-CoA synthetase (AMP-forming)/AMP-acid ligase II